MDVKLPTQNKEELFSEVDKNDWTDGATRETGLFQLQHRYVVGTLRSGLLVVDQEAAHYRILFDRFRARLTSGTGASQQCMFPSTLQLRGDEELALGRLEPILRAAGFDWTAGDAPLEIRLTGLPADIDLPEPEQMLHDMLRDEYPKTGDALASIREQISRIMARRSHIRAGKILSPIQMRQLVDELFACENPYYNPEGRPVLLTITIPEIMQRLGGPA
jgi:DNA mismatch repair protein MutL